MKNTGSVRAWLLTPATSRSLTGARGDRPGLCGCPCPLTHMRDITCVQTEAWRPLGPTPGAAARRCSGDGRAFALAAGLPLGGADGDRGGLGLGAAAANLGTASLGGFFFGGCGDCGGLAPWPWALPWAWARAWPPRWRVPVTVTVPA